jgi:uncharacterized membrane protein
MKDKLPPSRFRRQLKEQLPILESEGLVTPQQSQALFARYRLDSLSAEAMNTLLTVIYTIGSVLIGIGIISFVAAHWDDIGRTTKIVMIFAAMLTAHGTGFYLWQIRGLYPKLGHTLVLLGTLIFGANIGLMAQIFHIHENNFNGFFAWSVGAIIVAYALKSVPNAILAIAVAISAVLFGMRSIPFWFPLAAIIMFVPFIYYTKSRWALCPFLLLMMIAIPAAFLHHDISNTNSTIDLALSGLLFFSWGCASHQNETTQFISRPAWTFGVLAASIAAYTYSFNDVAENIVDHPIKFAEYPNILVVAGIILLLSLALIIISFFKRIKNIQSLLLCLISANLFAVVLLPHFVSFFEIVLVANLVFALMTILLFVASFTYEDRRIFWAAVLMAALLILTRTLEYETELLIKAIIFTACGVGIIVAGVLFERFLRARRLSNA